VRNPVTISAPGTIYFSVSVSCPPPSQFLPDLRLHG
jgi:hypothetical protein